ncbi:MAG TPA: hypothetical protein VIT92_14650, partial [Burkholderiaceae bacterium]
MATTQTDRPHTGRRQISVPAMARAFVVLVCLALVAVDGRSIWRAREGYLRAAQLSAQNVTRSVAQHAGDTIKKADTVLFGLVGDLERTAMSEAATAPLHPLLVARAGQLPEVQGLYIFDNAGHLAVSSLDGKVQPFNSADRDYFRHHQSNRTREPYIGTPIRNRADGEWVVPVSRRIE